LDPDADSDTKSSVNFMKSIGWVDPNDEILLEQPQGQSQSQPPKHHQNTQHQGSRGRGNYNRGGYRGSGRGGRGNGRGGRGTGNYYY